MQEIELKFLVPQARLKGLMRQTHIKSSQITQMSAYYYDTPQQTLAKAGIGLRIRQEGDAWVQTIKASGDGIAARLEHNTLLDNEHVQAMLDSHTLMPDLTIYEEISIAPALADFKLKKLAKNLTPQYVTDVQRTTRLLVDGDNSIEIAYDDGEIIHGEDDTQRDGIHEIEFELMAGDVEFLFATAKIWCKRYKLCLSTVTKAERGGLLVAGQAYSRAVRTDLKQLNVTKDSSQPAFIRAVVHNCLLQILPNSSAIVAGSTDSRHVLQLYIGLCRLKSALKAFADFSGQLNAEWLPILKQTATLLSDYHELAYLASYIEPKLEQSGAPIVSWDAEIKHIKVTPIDAVRANDLQLTLLELIAFTMSDATTEVQANQLAIEALPKILSKNYNKLFHSDDNPADLNAEAHYKVRSHLKNLCYLSEFTAPLYAKKKTKRWLKQIQKSQKKLEQYLDQLQYEKRYQQKIATNTNALYGAGWFAATLPIERKRCQKQMTAIQDSAIFWSIQR